MKTDYTRNNEIHKEALVAWQKAGFKGTIEAITGIGKTWIGLRAITGASLLAKRKISVLFLAERTNRKETLAHEIVEFEKTTGKSVGFAADITFCTYQSAYKWEGTHYDLIVADEIHDSLSPEYRKFYLNNTYRAIIGLSATVDRETAYFDDEEGEEYTKGDLLDMIAPVVYKYTMAQGQEEGTSRELELYVIYTHLDGLLPTVQAGTKAKPFKQTESAAYTYWNNKLKLSMIRKKTDFRSIAMRKKIIHNSLEKKILLLKVKNFIESKRLKSIVFAKFVDALEGICEVISYKNKKDTQETLDKLAKEEIFTIGNCKMLQQGMSIDGLDVCMLHSYDSKPKGFIQSVGRLRKVGDRSGVVIVFVTKDTKEEAWFKGMIKGSNLTPIVCSDFLEFKIKWDTRQMN